MTERESAARDAAVLALRALEETAMRCEQHLLAGAASLAASSVHNHEWVLTGLGSWERLS